MTRSRLPLVSDDHLLGLDGASEQLAPVVVGSDAWYTWLADQQIQSFSFRNRLGTFTARRERKRHGWYWYAYRKRAGRLRKAYLGKTEELTLERLNAVAAVLIGQGNSDEGPQVHPDVPGGSAPQISSDTVDGKDPFFLTPAPSFTSPIETTRATTHNLPTQLTPLIGREQEVESACALLRQPTVRLLTLTGTGGVGKTRLGLQIATDLLEDFADGVCFVSLAPISDPDLVLPTIAQTLGLRELGDQPLIERLTTSLHGKQLLLFLDNFEQVVRAAPVLTGLLERCLSLKVLVTSREVLRVRDEQQFPVLPLALPDLEHLPESETVSQYAAVALFLQRVQSVQPDFQLTAANARTIAAICTHLDGLPLALELAAARVRLLSPRALLARLEHRLAVLTQGPRDVHTRQQTLRNTLQWSYDLLDAQEQRLFRRLAVFVGGCTLEAVEAVCKALGDEMMNVLDGVASLLDKNLVRQQRAQRDEEPRLMMLETIREYGLECLGSSGELEAMRHAHAGYYLRFAEEAEPNLMGSEQRRWLDRLEREYENLRMALRWLMERAQTEVDQAELPLRMVGALEGLWQGRSHWSEARMFVERALVASEGVKTSARAKALRSAADFAVIEGDNDRAEILLRESLALSRKLEDTRGIVDSLNMLGGEVAREKGDFAAARSLTEEALELSRGMDNKVLIARNLMNLGILFKDQGDYEKAYVLLEESLNLYREVGNKYGVANTLFRLAQVLFLSKSDSATVRALLEDSLTLFRELDVKAGMEYPYWLLGLVALQEGDVALARSLFEERMAITKQLGDRVNIAESLSDLASVSARQNDYVAARALYEESLAIAMDAGFQWRLAPYLEGLASVLAAQGEPGRAARLWGAAEALRESMGVPIWPVERAAYERAVAAARSHLEEKAFSTAWAQGRTMTPDQVLSARRKATSLTPIPAASASAHPVVKSTTPYSDGLTKREIEVLRLVAMGLTDAQVAEQLVLSLHTVHAHLRTIYSKLRITSRSAATRYAYEHKLF